jgi:hypothetical protein
VAQAVECLLCKGKTLSSNPSPAKKQNKTNKKVVLSPMLGGSRL